MTTQKNAARVAVKAAACVDTSTDTYDELPPVDIHAVFQQHLACGYDHDLLLKARDAEAMASRLRGLSALSALLIAAGDSDAFKLGDWMEGGLHNAIHALVTDVEDMLSHCNAKAKKGGAA